jgi:excisionase family DNA binding protein
MQGFTASISETANILKVGKTSVYKLISRGELKTVRILSRQFVTLDSIRALTGGAA